MAKRKGVNVFLSLLIGIIPMANIAFALWIASKTDVAILERLKRLEEKR